MQTPELESKRIFLIACRDDKLVLEITKQIETHIRFPTIFVALDGAEALFKADNVFPHVAIVDVNLEKANGFVVTEKLLQKKQDHGVSVILLSSLPDQDFFVDQVVMGQVQFVNHSEIETHFPTKLVKALNRVAFGDSSS